jgi:hypothetical protein
MSMDRNVYLEWFIPIYAIITQMDAWYVMLGA